MMVVMAVGEAGLHLFFKLNACWPGVKSFLAPCCLGGQNGCVVSRRHFVLSLLGFAGFKLASWAQEVPWERARNSSSGPDPVPEEKRADINHASVDELVKVPGMTRSWAGRIVRYRPYRTKLDLVDRGIVPAQVYDRFKDWVIAHRERQ